MGEGFASILTPWPFLYVLFGLLIFGAGVWGIVRGITGKEGKRDWEAQRDIWEAYNRLENIERHTSELVKLNAKLVEAVQNLATVMWNYRQ